MGISGNIKTMQLAELLQWLSMGQKTGTLRIEKAQSKVTKRIFFEEGVIISSASTDPGEYLGRFLVSHGYLSEDAVNEAVARQKDEGRLLGSILVDMGLIDEPNLHQMLRLKAEESIYDIFTWDEGAFEFLDGELPAEHMVRMELDVQWIVLEGTRRTDEWLRIQELVPSPLCVPVLVADLDSLELEEFDRSVLDWVDDDRTVADISEGAMTALFQVSDIMARQVEAGNVKVVRPRIIEVPVPGTSDEAAEVETPAETVDEASPAKEDKTRESGAFYLPMMQQMMAQLQQQQQAMQQQYAVPAPIASPSPMPAPVAPAPAPTPVAAPPPSPPVDLGGGRALNFAGGGGGGAPASAAPAAAPTMSDAARLLAESEAALAETDHRTSLRLLREAQAAGGADAIETDLRTFEARLEKSIEKLGVGLSSVPKLKITFDELTQLDISPQEGFLLSRVDGSLDLRTLLRMTPVKKAEAFLLLSRLRETGAVMV